MTKLDVSSWGRTLDCLVRGWISKAWLGSGTQWVTKEGFLPWRGEEAEELSGDPQTPAFPLDSPSLPAREQLAQFPTPLYYSTN